MLFLVIEANTYQLVCIWFALGAVAASVLSVLNLGTTPEFVVFMLVSLLCLASLRPVSMKYFKNRKFKSNIDSLIGETVLVTEDVDNIRGKGYGKVKGLEWRLFSENNEPSQAGQNVYVKKIEGVKLVVSTTKGE